MLKIDKLQDSDEEALIGMIKSPSNISNGSRVQVQEVIMLHHIIQDQQKVTNQEKHV